MKNFRDLKVWEKAHQFVLDVYKSTAAFPKEEVYGLTSQLRRSSVSVPSNIAEGCGRGGDAEFGRFLNISMGSASEAEYQRLLAHDLEYLDPSNYARLNGRIIETKHMLGSLIQTVSSVPRKKADR